MNIIKILEEKLNNKKILTAEIEERENGLLVEYKRTHFQEDPYQINARLIARIGISYKTLEERYPNKSKEEILRLVKNRFEHDNEVKDPPLHREVFNTVFLALPITYINEEISIYPMVDTPYSIVARINKTDYSFDYGFMGIARMKDKKVPFTEKVIFGQCKVTDNENGWGKNVTVDEIGTIDGESYTKGIDLYNKLGLFRVEDEKMGKPIKKEQHTTLTQEEDKKEKPETKRFSYKNIEHTK